MKPRLFFIFSLMFVSCTSNSIGTLTGNVTFNNQPIRKGTISLMPESGNGSTAGGSIIDGKYTIKDLKPGRYRMTISLEPEGPIIMPDSPEAKKTYSKADIARMSAALPADVKGNDEMIEIVSGEQVKDFALTGTKR